MFEQDRFIVRLQQQLGREPSIIASFMAGSYGRNTQDDYSDLDVALIYRDALARDRAWQGREAFVKSILPYVPCKSFDGDHVRPFFHIALYGNGAKVDYRFESQDELRPSGWDGEIKVLKSDPAGWLTTYQQQSTYQPIPTPRITSDELAKLDNRFWVMFWDIYRLLLRSDTVKPYTIYLELLHFTLPPLLNLLPSESPHHRELTQAQYQHDAKKMRQHMQALLQVYLSARSAVVRRNQLHFVPHDAFERNLRRLIERNL